jgi:hypothetical protein
MNNDTLYRAVKLRIYLAAQGMSVAFQQPAASPSVERVIIVMMVRDEEDIIAQNLKHHYLLGVRKFLLILNACRDKTEEIVRAFQASHGDAIVILIFDPVEGYFQAAKTQAAIEFASTYFSGIRESVDWCFILDADEFISLEEGLEHLIYTAEHAGRDVIVFNLCNATSSVGDNYDTDADPYTHFDTVVACSVPVVTKNAFLMKGEPTITMGNHVLHYEDELSLSRVLVAAEHRARLVHVPQRSVNQLRAKIVNGGRALAGTHFASDVGGHWRRMYQEYLQRGDLMLAEAFARYRKTTLQDSANQAAFHF